MVALNFIIKSVIIFFALQCTECARILAIFPFPGPSQYILVLPYLKELAARGHELTVINAHPQKEKINNFRDVPVMKVHENYDELTNNLLEAKSKWEELTVISNAINYITSTTLMHPNVQKLIQSKEEHFDLVIVETITTESLYGFGPHYKAPLIGLSSFGTDPNIDELVGNVSPLAYSPLVTAGYTDRMTFWERINNIVSIWQEKIFMRLVHFPLQRKVYHQSFPKVSEDMLEVRNNFSLILLNQHFSMSFPRPYVPNMIEVGGLHISHTPAPLPKDMETFINGSKRGVIYFSMGSNIKSKDLPKEKLKIFLDTFALLDYKIMWKFEEPNLPGKPDNVFISKWFPQPDILAHPKVKLFITHFGLLSTTEAIYHGKPVVGIPMFYDQFLNAKRAAKEGFGLTIDFNTLSVDSLRAAILEVVERNPSYAEKAAKMSNLFRDQLVPPLERAVYWTEYVLRHRGATHMRSVAQEMSFIQENSLDTIGFLIATVILSVVITYFVLNKLIGLLFSRQVKTRKYKKN